MSMKRASCINSSCGSIVVHVYCVYVYIYYAVISRHILLDLYV